MRRAIFPIVLFSLCVIVFATQKAGIFARPMPVTERTVYYKLGSLNIPVKLRQYGDKNDLVFLSLHDDEYTSVEATKRILEKKGGLLIEVENNERRNLRFKLGSGYYMVDPNRMFSNEGITKSLNELGPVSRQAVNEVRRFAGRVLQLIPEETDYIIALHNNVHGAFSITSYAPGNKRSREAKRVYINEDHDPDDFFLTTDEKLYEKLADKKYNTILQQNIKPVDDGSLSVYCAKQDLRYVNLETEHGKTDLYYEMMKVLVELLSK
jgi:hypothetical protein